MSGALGSVGRPGSEEGPKGPARILISAAEPSADLHGAALIRATRRLIPDAEFVGLGGPQMAEAGCRILGDLSSNASMLLGSLRLVRRAWSLLGMLERTMREEPFDLCVVIDSPLLHLPLARRAGRQGVPLLYYIAPQTWAWAERRNKRIAKRVDRLAVILPFEQEYFGSKGIRADYVGNPLFDSLAERQLDDSLIAELRSVGGPLVTMLPGSRKQVVREVLPGQLAVCEAVVGRFKNARFNISVAGPQVLPDIQRLLAGTSLPIRCHEKRNGELIQAADLVLVASGTSTLEVAYYRKPMIVMYNHARWGYELIGRWLLRTKYLSLPNIIAGREIVPEFMPYYRTPAPIAARAVEMLSTPQTLERLSRELDELMTPMVKTGASDNTARIIAEMIDENAGDWRRR